MDLPDHLFWMQKAIDLAKQGETPFGAVIVANSRKHVGAFNTSKSDGPAAHAEINAIQRMKELDFEKPEELTLYSTVEPCPMCMGAIIWAGIGNVVFGATIEDAAEHGNQIMIKSEKLATKAWYPLKIEGEVLREQCKALFKS